MRASGVARMPSVIPQKFVNGCRLEPLPEMVVVRGKEGCIKVYSDGSVHDGKVGAAAILRREGKSDRVMKLHLGTTEQHTVYEAELVGMIMGLHLIKTERRSKTKCVLNIDNQAAIVAIKSEMKRLGQHLAASVLQLAKQLLDKNGS